MRHVNEQIVAAELYLRQQFQLMLQENVVQKLTRCALLRSNIMSG